MKQCMTHKAMEINADTLTPIGIYKRLTGQKKFLLESSFQHETKGKYSYIGSNPYEEIIGYGQETIVKDLIKNKEKHYPYPVLEYFKQHFPKVETDFPLPFTGGAIGYVAYDAVRPYMAIGDDKHDDLDMPDYHFMVYDTIIAYEHRTETAHIIALNMHDEAEEVIDNKLQGIKTALKQQVTIEDPSIQDIHFEPCMDKTTFMNKVKQAQHYIEQGEAEQIVLSQRMVADLHDDPFSFYRKLRTSNPSPYMFYIDFTDYLIIGASPESLVETTGNQVVTNPIAGTRPRGATFEEDEQLKRELLEDPKELREHDMLVELSKKDLASICKPDSIHVPVYQDIVKYEHVMHIVSEAHGTLREDTSSFDALVTCLPAGTVSGSPKERAMQIINELEEEKRGFYAGGIGYITFDHDLTMAISIRSLVIKDKKAYAQAGAGIVKESLPENEFMETLHKAKSLTNI